MPCFALSLWSSAPQAAKPDRVYDKGLRPQDYPHIWRHTEAMKKERKRSRARLSLDFFLATYAYPLQLAPLSFAWMLT